MPHRFAVAALASLSLGATLCPAQAGEILPQGIYAMIKDESGGTGLPPGLEAAVEKACKNTPALVGVDGMIRALKPNAMETVQAGGPFFLPMGEMRCAALSGDAVSCRNFEGESLTEAAPLTAGFAPLGSGVWRLSVVERNASFLLAPCAAAMFDITLPNGRNVLAEMTARDDGGPAIVPAN